MLAFPLFNPVKLVEVLDLTGNLHGEFGSVEAGDLLYASLTIKNGAAEGGFTDSIRADHSQAGDDCASEHRKNSIIDAGFMLHAAGNLHLGSVLPLQMHLLQLCLRCLFC